MSNPRAAHPSFENGPLVGLTGFELVSPLGQCAALGTNRYTSGASRCSTSAGSDFTVRSGSA